MDTKKQIIMGGVAIMSAISLAANAEGPTLEVSGVVEVEVTSGTTNKTPPTAKEKNSSIDLATVEIGFSSQINKDVSANVVLLYEGNGIDTPLTVDEGTITIGSQEEGFHLTMGQFVVPFGVFDSNMVSDPITLDMAETPIAAAMLAGFTSGNFHGAAYIFNGKTMETGTTDDTVENLGFSIGFTNEKIDVGLDFINSIAETDGFQSVINATSIKSFVAGTAIHAKYEMDKFSVMVEHIASSDSFETTDFATAAAAKVEPSATNIEVGVDFGQYQIGLASQSTDDAVDLGLPEKKIILAYSREIYEATSLAFEYSSAEDYAGLKTTALTLQVAVEF